MVGDVQWIGEFRYPDEVRHRCFTCGFLGKVSTGPQKEVLEVTFGQRSEGAFYEPVDETVPWCLLGIVDLRDEVRAHVELIASTPELLAQRLPTITKAVIQEKSRNCREWFPYTQFLSPKEHLVRRDVERLEDARRAWQQDLEDDRREWLSEFHSEMETNRGMESSRWNHRFAVLACLQVLLAVAAIWVTIRFSTPQDNVQDVRIVPPPAIGTRESASPSPGRSP